MKLSTSTISFVLTAFGAFLAAVADGAKCSIKLYAEQALTKVIHSYDGSDAVCIHTYGTYDWKADQWTTVECNSDSSCKLSFNDLDDNWVLQEAAKNPFKWGE